MRITLWMACGLLAACATEDPAARMAEIAAPAVPLEASTAAPEGVPPGTCWARDVTPARAETVRDRVLIAPPEMTVDGITLREAVYREEVRTFVTEDAREIWFETPCAGDLPEDFSASLQRALAARGLYAGPVTGEIDAATRDAVRAYQAPQGLDSGTLSLAAARQMGLVAVARDEAGAAPAGG
ncbi:MAG: peptidoglycan-binding domain-containing protein [Pseudomonadota bacterium]